VEKDLEQQARLAVALVEMRLHPQEMAVAAVVPEQMAQAAQAELEPRLAVAVVVAVVPERHTPLEQVAQAAQVA